MKFTPHRLALALASTVWLAAPAAAAQDAEIDKVRGAMSKLIATLIEQGVLAREAGNALLTEAGAPPVPPPARSATATAGGGAAAGVGAAAVTSAKPAPATVRVPYIPEFVRKELKEEIRLELAAQAFREGWSGPGAVPGWVRSLEWDGDVRFGAQFIRYQGDNAAQISVSDTNRSRALSLLNTSEDRARLRARTRFGLTAKIDENWSAGVRLSTGNATDPVSANQTLGTYGNRYSVLLDRAYIRWQYRKEFNVVAGRFANPWFGTDLQWDSDLNFDGVALQWTPKLRTNIRGFATLAALPVQEVELSSADKWLFGGQVGATLASSPRSIGGRVGLGYFHYSKLLGRVSPPGSTINEFSAPTFAQKGNTYYNISSDPARPLLGLAAEYQLVNLTAQIDLPSIAGKRVVVTGDYVHNLGFNRREVSSRAGANVDAQVDAYHLQVAFGSVDVKALHEWQVSAAYKRIERDALLDAFNDSNFRLGGTDSRGIFLGGKYGVAKNTFLNLRYFSGDSISGPPLSIDVLNVDLTLKF